MSYRKHLYNPEARKAEAEMREREAAKDYALEMWELLKRIDVEGGAGDWHADIEVLLTKISPSRPKLPRAGQ